MESIKKDLLTIKLKLDNPASTQPHENYADKVKTNQNETLKKVQMTPEVEQDKIVILATQCSSTQIRLSEIASKSQKRLLQYFQTKNTERIYYSAW